MSSTAPSIVLAPTLLHHAGNELEVAAVVAPRVVMREVLHIFPTTGLTLDSHLIVVPTCQRSKMELVNWCACPQCASTRSSGDAGATK